jgi:hypothetical protein
MFRRSCGLMVTVATLAVTAAACGSSVSHAGSSTDASLTTGADPGLVLGHVGQTSITRSELSHWMATLAGGDYYELSAQHTVPVNLVSDPPRYGACVASLEAAAAASPHKVARPSNIELLTKCRQLYQALRSQAMGLLVDTLWVIGVAHSEGATVSNAEVLAYYNKAIARQFPRPSERIRYQAARRVSTSDELLLFKKNLVSQKLLAKLKPEGPAATARFAQAQASWTAKTDCSPGYVVEHCKQFHGEAPRTAALPPASVLIEQVAALATGRCINRPACAKQ